MVTKAIDAPAIFDQLREPFPADAILWRVQQSGKGGKSGVYALVLAYIDSRAVQDRLDALVGPENWRVKYEPVYFGEHGGFLCTLSIRVGDEWLEKQDGAGLTDVEPVKGGISDAFKRAAVLFGIGRYLYDLPATFADVVDKRDCKNATRHRFKVKGDETVYYFNPPELTAEFLPSGKQPETEQKPPAEKQSTYYGGTAAASEKQVKAIYAIGKDKYDLTDAQVKMFCGQVLNRTVAHMSELTIAEASKIIDILNEPDRANKYLGAATDGLPF